MKGEAFCNAFFTTEGTKEFLHKGHRAFASFFLLSGTKGRACGAATVCEANSFVPLKSHASNKIFRLKSFVPFVQKLLCALCGKKPGAAGTRKPRSNQFPLPLILKELIFP